MADSEDFQERKPQAGRPRGAEIRATISRENIPPFLHNRTVPSKLPDTSVLPSGVKVTDLMVSS